MKNYSCFVGIDVSKAKLDVTFLNEPFEKQTCHFVVSNDDKGIGQIVKYLSQHKIPIEKVLMCYEDTGVYSLPLSCYLSQKQIDHWMIAAIEIKRSKGISRGKTDKSDSKDIAFYAASHLHKLKLSSIAEADIMELKLLFTEREKVMKALLLLETTKEGIGFIPKGIMKNVLKINKGNLIHLQRSLKLLEQKMQEIIASNETIKQQDKIIQSIPGVGPQTSLYLIIATKAFQSFDNWRQLACYAGVAPFEYSSGSSVKGRTKVHPLADKKMKSLLNMCALNAKRSDVEIKQYFDRKVGEGKNKMLVLNNIRCKLLSRIFAIINRNTPYVNLQKFAA
jgi:transposase